MNAPPLFVSFSNASAFQKALQSGVAENPESSLELLWEKGLPPVASAKSLAVLFGFTTRFVMAMAARPHRYYRVFSIRKGSKSRVIKSPRVALKLIQKWFGFHVSRIVVFESCVHGFVLGRSTITAAKSHLNANWIASLDIQDFFPSINREQVYRAISQLGYSAKASRTLTDLLTIDNQLPQGSPASPVIANLVFGETDARLIEFSKDCNIRYTRYADDLVFSGVNVVPANLVETVTSILHENGWKVAETKVRVSERSDRLVVHGIHIHGSILQLSKRYRNQLRMYRFALKNKELDDSVRRRYAGHLAYADAVARANYDAESRE